MADNKDLNVNIGANTTGLEEGMAKAGQSVENFNSKLKSTTKPIGDATNSLVNLSRIAQDSGYGFLGIANNLNPMLESFQRLQKETGSASNALKSMLQGLAGPAGLGVLVGVATAILGKFGDKLFQVGEETKKTADEYEKWKLQLSETDKYAGNELQKVAQLVASYQNHTLSLEKRREILKSLNSIAPEYFKGLSLEKTSIDDLYKSYAKYAENIYLVSQAKGAAKQVEQLSGELAKTTGRIHELDGILTTLKGTWDVAVNAKDNYETLNNILKKTFLVTEDVNKISELTGIPVYKVNQQLSERNKLLATQYGLTNQILELSKKTVILTDNTTNEPKKTKIKSPEKLISDGVYDAALETRFQEETRNTQIQNRFPEAARNIGVGGGAFMGMDETTKGKINTTKNEMTEFTKKVKEGFNQANDAAEKFASTMAGGITNSLQSVFDALMRGDNVFEALSKSVLQFAEDLAFAILRAEILAAIQATIATSGTGVAGAAAGGTGILNVLMNLLGLGVSKNATGGITTGPSLGLIGEAGPEAIMPLSKLSSFLNTSFNAGAMSGNSTGGSSQFVLRGQDLLLAVNRSQKASNIKGQSISLA